MSVVRINCDIRRFIMYLNRIAPKYKDDVLEFLKSPFYIEYDKYINKFKAKVLYIPIYYRINDNVNVYDAITKLNYKGFIW